VTTGADSRRTSLRVAQKQLTRQRLIDAARQCFTDKGFSDTTVEDIVELAGASRATFYLYFKTKDEVLADMFGADYLAPLFDLFAEFPRAPVTAAAMQKWIQAFIDLHGQHRATLRVWMLADSRHPSLRAETHRMAQQISDNLGAAIAAARGSTTAAAKRDARIMAFLMYSQIEQYCYFRVMREYPMQDSSAIRILVQLWLPQLARHSTAADARTPR
jgi:AcrR family transcriptional regulator